MLVLHGRRVVNFLQFFHPCTPFGAECKQKCRPTQMCMGRHQDTAVPPKLPAACAASHLNALNAGQRERLLLFPAPAPKRQRSARPHRLPPAPALFHGRPGPACARGTCLLYTSRGPLVDFFAQDGRPVMVDLARKQRRKCFSVLLECYLCHTRFVSRFLNIEAACRNGTQKRKAYSLCIYHRPYALYFLLICVAPVSYTHLPTELLVLIITL